MTEDHGKVDLTVIKEGAAAIPVSVMIVTQEGEAQCKLLNENVHTDSYV